MYYNFKFKTVRWQWVEALEEPVVKHIVTRELMSKDAVFAQVTVRFHSRQVKKLTRTNLLL